jgi:hypothetical protein
MLTPDLKWISAIAVKNSIINNENETHLEIFFCLFDFLFYCCTRKEIEPKKHYGIRGILPAAVVNNCRCITIPVKTDRYGLRVNRFVSLDFTIKD